MTRADIKFPEINDEPIRISLFRVHPAHEHQVLERFEGELGENCVAFKALGHFDIIVIYKGITKMLFRGAIPGIRSFSNINCVSWEQDDPVDVIKMLKEKRVIALSVISLHSDVIKNHGGIHSHLFKDIPSPVLHFNSLTWGEQVIILSDDNMESLTERFQQKIHSHVSSFIDIHTLLGINMEEVKKIDSNISNWEEMVSKSVSLRWLIDIESQGDAAKSIQKSLVKMKEDTNSQFDFEGPKRSFSMRSLVYELKAEKWSFAIKAIRDIRKNAEDAFSSTKLQILTEGNCLPISDEMFLDERFKPATSKSQLIMDIDKNTCKRIRTNMGYDVGRQVIQAVYTVLDASWDSPSDYAVESLIPAAEKLIWNTTTLEDKYSEDNTNLTMSGEDQRKQARLMEAERLMTATRQRLAGMPITREFSRLPFELPPPGPRLYYEAAEYVAAAFLQRVFNDKDSPPYVLIDTVDGPQYGGLAIVLPHRQLLVPRMYEAITHESLHHYIQKEEKWREKILGSDKFVQFYKEGRILSNRNQAGTQLGRYKLIEDIVVESMDFIFSYLEDIDLYMKEEWIFFIKGFDQAVKTLIGPETLLPYVLRTFAVRLQYEARKLNGKDSSMCCDSNLDRLISIPHKLRIMLREHLDNIEKIIKSVDKDLGNRFPPELVVNLQHDIEELSPVLCTIYSEVSDLREGKSDVLRQMREYLKIGEDNIVKRIMEKKVVCDRIPFPHLVINNLSSKINNGMSVSGPKEENMSDSEQESAAKKKNDIFKDVKDTEKENEAIARALIMSVWNASQLNKCEKAREENEQQKQ